MQIIRKLVIKLAEENPWWGYGRIQGALSEVGYKISSTTVGNILRENGIYPAQPDLTKVIGERLYARIWQ